MICHADFLLITVVTRRQRELHWYSRPVTIGQGIWRCELVFLQYLSISWHFCMTVPPSSAAFVILELQERKTVSLES